jgi:hypothetical protein
MKCPYCGTETKLGRLWFTERSEAQKAYDEATKQKKQKYSPFIVNRWLNRGILIAAAVLLLSFFIGINLSTSDSPMAALRYRMNAEKIDAELAESFESGDYRRVRELMKEYDLYGGDRYSYSQVSFLYYDFREFNVEKYSVIEDIEKTGTVSEIQLSIALTYGRRVVTASLGNYSLISEKNTAYYETCCRDVEAFMVGYLGMTDEEWAAFSCKDAYPYSDDEVATAMIERRSWEHE